MYQHCKHTIMSDQHLHDCISYELTELTDQLTILIYNGDLSFISANNDVIVSFRGCQCNREGLITLHLII